MCTCREPSCFDLLVSFFSCYLCDVIRFFVFFFMPWKILSAIHLHLFRYSAFWLFFFLFFISSASLSFFFFFCFIRDDKNGFPRVLLFFLVTVFLTFIFIFFVFFYCHLHLSFYLPTVNLVSPSGAQHSLSLPPSLLALCSTLYEISVKGNEITRRDK